MDGNDLKSLRMCRNLQVQELAAMLGISRRALYNYEALGDEPVPLTIKYSVLYLLGHAIIEIAKVERKRVTPASPPQPRRDANVIAQPATENVTNAPTAYRRRPGLTPTPTAEQRVRPVDWQGE